MKQTIILNIFSKLLSYYGNQNWWPGETKDEIIIGAILTQNTNWTNVEKAISNLKQNNCLTLDGIKAIDIEKLKIMIRPAGFFNVKAGYLKNYSIAHSDYDFDNLPIDESRGILLQIKGIGPETADSILLYGFKKPVFVIDAYTKRIFSRLNLCSESISYSKLQKIFMDSLPLETQMFNEYHGLIVKHAKEFCKKKPLCEECFLHKECKYRPKSYSRNRNMLDNS